MKKLVSLLLLLIAAVSLAGAPASKGADKTLLFFRNPYGAPCQYQLKILEAMGDTLKKGAHLQFVSTNVDADLPKFEAWGIRGLPMLIIVDAKGKELFRFSPGVQNSAAILKQLKR